MKSRCSLPGRGRGLGPRADVQPAAADDAPAVHPDAGRAARDDGRLRLLRLRAPRQVQAVQGGQGVRLPGRGQSGSHVCRNLHLRVLKLPLFLKRGSGFFLQSCPNSEIQQEWFSGGGKSDHFVPEKNVVHCKHVGRMQNPLFFFVCVVPSKFCIFFAKFICNFLHFSSQQEII